jgi:hypothetical protein
MGWFSDFNQAIVNGVEAVGEGIVDGAEAVGGAIATGAKYTWKGAKWLGQTIYHYTFLDELGDLIQDPSWKNFEELIEGVCLGPLEEILPDEYAEWVTASALGVAVGVVTMNPTFGVSVALGAKKGLDQLEKGDIKGLAENMGSQYAAAQDNGIEIPVSTGTSKFVEGVQSEYAKAKKSLKSDPDFAELDEAVNSGIKKYDDAKARFKTAESVYFSNPKNASAEKEYTEAHKAFKSVGAINVKKIHIQTGNASAKPVDNFQPPDILSNKLPTWLGMVAGGILALIIIKRG